MTTIIPVHTPSFGENLPPELWVQIFDTFTPLSTLKPLYSVNKGLNKLLGAYIRNQIYTASIKKPTRELLRLPKLKYKKCDSLALDQQNHHLKLLPHLTKLTIDLQEPVITHEIKKLTELMKLKLVNYRTLDFRISSYIQLRTLNCSSLAPVQECQLDFLKFLPSLRNYAAPFVIFDEGEGHLQFLPKLTSCTVLNIDQKNLKHLAAMTKLSAFKCKTTSISDTDLDLLSSLKFLSKLSFGKGENMTNAGLLKLKSLKNLRNFSISSSDHLTDGGICQLTSRLTKLSISNCRLLGNDGQDLFDYFKRLKFVLIKDCPSLSQINSFCIKDRTRLRSLILRNTPHWFDPSPESLSHLTNLRVLLIPCYGHASSMNMNFTRLTNLTHLDLSRIETGISSLSFIQKYHHIQILKLSRINLDGSFEWLKNLTSLTHLNLASITSVEQDAHFSDIHLEQFASSLTNLRILNVSHNDLSHPASLRALSGLTKMQQLNLSACQIAPLSLKDLYNLKSLYILTLDKNPLIYRYHKIFKKLTCLQVLNLRGNKVPWWHKYVLKERLVSVKVQCGELDG